LLNTISNYGDGKVMNIFHVDLLPLCWWAAAGNAHS
jgi:hypothetical protein